MPIPNEYVEHLERARQRFRHGYAADLHQVRSLYRQTAESIRQDILKLTPGTLRHSHLTALQAKLDLRASELNGGILKVVHHGIWESASAGNQVASQVSQHMLSDTIPAATVSKIFAGINERAIVGLLARTRGDGLKISSRVWNIAQIAQSKVRRIVEEAIVRGQDSRTTARQVQQYLKPGVAKAHKAEVAKRLGIPKDISYQAMRLARTEMNNAFHEGMVIANQSNPGYRGILWRLSGAHVIRDICTDMAADMSHGARGYYPKGLEPVRPHPNCMCVPIPVYDSPEIMVERLREWRQIPGSQPGIESWYVQVAHQFISRAGLLAAPPVVAPIVAAPPPPPPPPRAPKVPTPLIDERITSFKKLGGGVSETWTGTVAGKKYVFKSPKPISRMDMVRGNAEAELLSPEILELAGVPCPKAFYKSFQGAGVVKGEKLLQIEFVDGVQSASDFMFSNPDWETLLNYDRFRRMQVVDVLIGNGDRHTGNFFIRMFGAAKGDIVPIDHNLAFVTGQVVTPGTTWNKGFVKGLSRDVSSGQNSTSIMRRGARMASETLRQSTLDDYLIIVKDIQKNLTDDVIDEMIDRLPDDLADLSRKEELQDILKWRRDNLATLIDEGM